MAEYTTPNGTTVQKAKSFSEAAADADDLQVEVRLRTAYRTVRRLARPREDPPSEDYREAAGDAELQVFDYLASTKGFVKSESLSGVSTESFTSDEGVKRIVEDVMAEHIEEKAGGASDTAYLGTWPY